MSELSSSVDLDEPAVTDWIERTIPGCTPPLSFARVGNGQSALSYLVTDASRRRWVLRRPPLGTVVESAHDMAREHHILTGLARATGKVPRSLAICEDVAVTGATFYVMEHVEGLVLSSVAVAEQLDPAARAAASQAITSTLVELQQIDLDAVGLHDLRREEALISRQLRRWLRQWRAQQTRDLPLIDELAERFAAQMPPEREVVLVHGDYRLDNAIVDHGGAVRAVLDWELCSVGDPLADVGLMIAYWGESGEHAGGADSLFQERVTVLPGFPSASELGAAYAAASGRSIDDLGFWIAFAYWKIAIIVEGVYRRWLDDPRNGAGAGGVSAAVPRLAELAREALDQP